MNPASSDYFTSVRNLAHAVGRREWLSRKARGFPSALGIRHWAFLVIEEAKRQRWTKIPDIDTVERRINELCYEEYGAFWYNLPFKTMEPDGSTGRLKVQSSYLPNPRVFEDEWLAIQKAAERSMIETRHGKRQMALLDG